MVASEHSVRYDRTMTKQPSERTIIITGASAGIGLAAARELSRTDRVILVGRSKETVKLAKELGVEYFRADFSKLADVRNLAVELLKVCPKIDLLINNAGGVMKSITTTKDGFEQTFQVNYLAQFLLTELLMERLISSKAGIINTSSAAHMFSRLHLDDLQFATKPFAAYADSKLLDLIHAQELTRRYNKKGVQAVSFHPGVVATSFANTSTGPFSWLYNTSAKQILKTPAQGADTMVWLANNRDLWLSGSYYNKRKLASISKIAQSPTVGPFIWDQTVALLAKT